MLSATTPSAPPTCNVVLTRPEAAPIAGPATSLVQTTNWVTASTPKAIHGPLRRTSAPAIPSPRHESPKLLVGQASPRAVRPGITCSRDCRPAAVPLRCPDQPCRRPGTAGRLALLDDDSTEVAEDAKAELISEVVVPLAAAAPSLERFGQLSATIEVFEHFGDPGAGLVLIDLLSSAHDTVREWSAWAIAQLGVREAVPALRAAHQRLRVAEVPWDDSERGGAG